MPSRNAGRRLRVLSTFLCPLLCATSLLAFARPVRAEIIDRIVAIVNDSVITQVELNRTLEQVTKGETRKKAAVPNEMQRRQVLEGLIDERLFNQLVLEAKIEVTEDDLARAIANVLYQNKMTIEQLRGEIARKGMAFSEYKKDIEQEIKRIKYINQVIGPQVKITDQDLRDFYQQHQEQFRGQHNAHIAEIAMPLAGITSQEQFEALYKTARGIVVSARKSSDFSGLAKKHSKGPNATEGGDLGMISLKDLPEEVAAVVRTLKVGQVSAPILTPNAIIIVKLISLPELSAEDFDRLREEIYSQVYDERIEETLNSYLLRQRQRAFIEIR